MYGRTETLEEREKSLMSIQQQYGETIRNYGYRVTEALEKYKQGYKTKYELNNIDQAYATHLAATAIQCFKRGLNNTILKEKVATYRTSKLDDIIEETEIIEKMLTTTSGTSTIQNQNTYTPANTPTQQITQPPNPHTLQRLPQSNFKQSPIILCNFCQKPNHTWDVCRTRLNTERRNQNTYNSNNYIYTPTRQQYQPIQMNRNYNNYRQYPQYNPTMNQANNTPMQHQKPNEFYTAPQVRNHFTASQNQEINGHNRYTPRQNFGNQQTPNQNHYINRPQKYCSHCKTTTGHTFDECRSKFYTNKGYDMNNHGRQQQRPDTRTIEERMESMKLNSMESQPHDHNTRRNQFQEHSVAYNLDQGNANGSDQI